MSLIVSIHCSPLHNWMEKWNDNRCQVGFPLSVYLASFSDHYDGPHWKLATMLLQWNFLKKSLPTEDHFEWFVALFSSHHISTILPFFPPSFFAHHHPLVYITVQSFIPIYGCDANCLIKRGVWVWLIFLWSSSMRLSFCGDLHILPSVLQFSSSLTYYSCFPPYSQDFRLLPYLQNWLLESSLTQSDRCADFTSFLL
jgi:hypothetical protein